MTAPTRPAAARPDRRASALARLAPVAALAGGLVAAVLAAPRGPSVRAQDAAPTATPITFTVVGTTPTATTAAPTSIAVAPTATRTAPTATATPTPTPEPIELAFTAED